MKKKNDVRRITKNAIMLTLFCLIGMISIPIGPNIKLSLQLLILYIICLTAESAIDCTVVSLLYLIIGLFIPVYAGFTSSFASPTFGYVISFVVISPIIYFFNKITKLNPIIRMIIACLVGLIICYVIGTIYMMFYLSLSLKETLFISVVPYIPFDLIKIFLAIQITIPLQKRFISD